MDALQAEWGSLDLHSIRDRAEPVHHKMQALGDAVSIDDFEVVKMLGSGANAQAYLARCKPGSQLGHHANTLVVLKAMLKLKQPDGALGRTSSVERTFRADVEKEATGPGFPEYRFNVVQVLGTFMDSALGLAEYKALDPDGIFIDPHTAFIVTPFFCGGTLSEMIKREGSLPEPRVLSILSQLIDAVVKLQRHDRAHRDLKPDNVFFSGDRESLALADFGEVGPLTLQFTKGRTSPGGAQDYIAPDIMARIARMDDGETVELDYLKNDVYAMGMIAYRMCMGMDAGPWPAGSEPHRGALKRIPADRYSQGLRALIEDGLLEPEAGRRMSAGQAENSVLEMNFGGMNVGGGGGGGGGGGRDEQAAAEARYAQQQAEQVSGTPPACPATLTDMCPLVCPGRAAAAGRSGDAQADRGSRRGRPPSRGAGSRSAGAGTRGTGGGGASPGTGRAGALGVDGHGGRGAGTDLRSLALGKGFARQRTDLVRAGDAAGDGSARVPGGGGGPADRLRGQADRGLRPRAACRGRCHRRGEALALPPAGGRGDHAEQRGVARPDPSGRAAPDLLPRGRVQHPGPRLAAAGLPREPVLGLRGAHGGHVGRARAHARRSERHVLLPVLQRVRARPPPPHVCGAAPCAHAVRPAAGGARRPRWSGCWR